MTAAGSRRMGPVVLIELHRDGFDFTATSAPEGVRAHREGVF